MVKIKIKDTTAGGGVVGCKGDSNGCTPVYFKEGGIWSAYLSNNGTSWDIANNIDIATLDADTIYWLKAQFTGTEYIFSYSLDNKNWTVAKIIYSSKAVYGGLTVHLGNNRGKNTPFKGEIDLGSFYIKINNKCVFTGGYETTTNIYLNEPLRKVGNYVDYIDFGKQKEFRNVEVIDDTGTLTIEESLKGLTTPKEETIELPNIPTIKGTNIIEVDTNIQPSNVEVVYKGK